MKTKTLIDFLSLTESPETQTLTAIVQTELFNFDFVQFVDIEVNEHNIYINGLLSRNSDDVNIDLVRLKEVMKENPDKKIILSIADFAGTLHELTNLQTGDISGSENKFYIQESIY